MLKSNFPLLLGILIAIISRLLEPVFRYGKVAKSIKTYSNDNNSTILLVLLMMINFLFLLSGLLLNHFKVLQLFNLYQLAYFGNILMATGIFIRIKSVRTLRDFYTRTLRIQLNQKVIDTGMYKFIRHPGYLGSILLWTGAGISSNNIPILIMICILTLMVYFYRIHNEEKMLLINLGDDYSRYVQKTRKLIPGIF